MVGALHYPYLIGLTKDKFVDAQSKLCRYFCERRAVHFDLLSFKTTKGLDDTDEVEDRTFRASGQRGAVAWNRRQDKTACNQVGNFDHTSNELSDCQKVSISLVMLLQLPIFVAPLLAHSLLCLLSLALPSSHLHLATDE